MAIEVFIKREVQQGAEARKLMPLILQLRALATVQPGYISGRTLGEVGDTGKLLVISAWQSIEDWKRWSNSRERKEIDQKIESLSGQKAEYTIYETITVHSDR